LHGVFVEIGNAMEHLARSAGRPPRMQAFAARASGFRPKGQKHRKRKIARDPRAMLQDLAPDEGSDSGEKHPLSRFGCSLKLPLLEIYR
jgi:hypothetical protein